MHHWPVQSVVTLVDCYTIQRPITQHHKLYNVNHLYTPTDNWHAYTERDRDTHRDTQRETERENRQTDRHRQTDRQTHTHTHTETERQTGSGINNRKLLLTTVIYQLIAAVFLAATFE